MYDVKNNISLEDYLSHDIPVDLIFTDQCKP